MTLTVRPNYTFDVSVQCPLCTENGRYT